MCLISALLALLFAWIFQQYEAQDEGTDRMKEIAEYVREGAMAYLKRQYTVVTKVFLILVVLLIDTGLYGSSEPICARCFSYRRILFRSLWISGMKTATFASNRTAWAASKSLNKGLQVALRSGAVMGLVVVGFGFWI